MMSGINIYSNNKIYFFLTQLFEDYNFKLKNLDQIDCFQKKNNINIIFLSNDKDIKKINIDDLTETYLVLVNTKIKLFTKHKNIKILNTPLPINKIKNLIENFKGNSKIQFHDIFIKDEKLINKNSKTFCYLTNIEFKILEYLIKEKETHKDYIKEKILNIKSDIETNSLDSHLTRIRKKIIQIKSSIKIQSTGNKLFISN